MMAMVLPIVPLQGFDPNFLLTQMFNGLVLGMILVLISLGLSIIFGMMGIVNFAHGDLLLVGVYVAWTVTEMTGNIIAGFLVAPIAVAGLGLVVERFLLQRTYDHGPLLQLLLTFGLAEFLRGSVQLVWGSTGKEFQTPEWGTGMIDLVAFNYPAYRLFVITAAAAIVLATYLFITRTDIGLIIRAGTQDREMVGTLGLEVSRVFLIVFALGAALAGIAGALIGPIRGANPTLGVDLLIPSFVVVVIGGIGSFRGSIVAGVLVGELIVLTGLVFSSASQVVIFVLMAIILWVRPRGLFGREGVFG